MNFLHSSHAHMHALMWCLYVRMCICVYVEFSHKKENHMHTDFPNTRALNGGAITKAVVELKRFINSVSKEFRHTHSATLILYDFPRVKM